MKNFVKKIQKLFILIIQKWVFSYSFLNCSEHDYCNFSLEFVHNKRISSKLIYKIQILCFLIKFS